MVGLLGINSIDGILKIAGYLVILGSLVLRYKCGKPENKRRDDILLFVGLGIIYWAFLGCRWWIALLCATLTYGAGHFIHKYFADRAVKENQEKVELPEPHPYTLKSAEPAGKDTTVPTSSGSMDVKPDVGGKEKKVPEKEQFKNKPDSSLDYEKYPTLMRLPAGTKRNQPAKRGKTGVNQSRTALPERPSSEEEFLIENGVLVRYYGRAVRPSIPEGVREIGNGAFAGNSYVCAIAIPEGVRIIGQQAFAGCGNLGKVTMPQSLARIGEKAFAGTALGSVVIPKNVYGIGMHAFRDCGQLTEITIPDGLMSIPASAFENCRKIREIHASEDWKRKNAALMSVVLKK